MGGLFMTSDPEAAGSGTFIPNEPVLIGSVPLDDLQPFVLQAVCCCPPRATRPHPCGL